MPRMETAPTVRVIFACTGCGAPFQATQVNEPADGAFACDFCGEEVYSWSDSHNYTDWRYIRRPSNRKAWSWERYRRLRTL